jgi:carboxypeptidase Taq
MLKDSINKLNELDLKLSSVFFTQSLMEWDSETIASKEGVEQRSLVAGEISKIYFNEFINENVDELLKELNENMDSLDEISKAKLELYTKKFNNISKIPVKEYGDYQALITKSYSAWENARENNDYKLFAPYLKEIIEYQKRFVKLRDSKLKTYDSLLDEFEPGIDMERLDVFFKELREEIVPLTDYICENQKGNWDFLSSKYDIYKQEKFSRSLLPKLGFDINKGLLAVSVHPFTLNLSRDDVRITTRFVEDEITNSVFGTIHETGHAIYEQNISKEFGVSALTTGVSMGIHESQSRLFENNFGRNINFWKGNYSALRKMFDVQLKDVSLEDWYKGINRVNRSLIRTEADEVTYPLHIMVRYEIEKKIFNEDIDIMELPGIWNDLYKEYLGVTPKSDNEGILQDVHWAGGAFGYFPSYALGSAYAAQFEMALRKTVDVDRDLKDMDMRNINGWLKDNIHKFGSSKKPDRILIDSTGEEFNPKYYTNYLKNKYKNPLII